jgi:hypothetical protein
MSGVNVVGLEADGVEDADRLGENLTANAISGHGYDGVFRHMNSFYFVSDLKLATAALSG